MSESKSWNLKPFQEEVLKVFRAFEGICKRHNLRYYAFGGTALGAVRHKGFIPWDDDFDILMPREDYIAFVKVVKDELPQYLRFTRGGEGRHSPIYFSKIINESPGIVERMCRKTGLAFDFAPFVDIFVLDGLPENVFDFKKWWTARRRLRYVQLYRYPKTGECSFPSRFSVKLFAAKVIGFFLSLFYPRTKTNDEMMMLFDNAALRWPFAGARMVAEVAFFKFRTRLIFPKSVFEPAKEIPFEDGTIRVPARVEVMLEQYFGDYMTPPPLEYQIPEHAMHRAYNHV